jgi:flavorubredoxin
MAGTGEQRYGGGSTVEVVPDVFAIGGWVRLGPEVSWVPRGTGGFDPCLCYLVRDPEESMLVDTGLLCHREEVVRRIREVLPAGSKVSIIITRHEPDCFGNLGHVLCDLPIGRIFGFGQNPVEFFREDELPMPRAAIESFELRRLGDAVDVGRRHIELLPGAMGSLRTSWPYDRESQVLFCSDAFNWYHMSRPDGDWIVEGRAARPDPETVAAHLLARFEWLPYQRRGRVGQALDRIFTGRPVVALAPTHGCIVRGADAVAGELAAVRAGVDQLATWEERSA